MKHAVIIGGGYIGLEMAENLKHRGVAVKVIEKESLLAGTLDEEPARHIEQALIKEGIEVKTGITVTGFLDDGDGAVCAVETGEGRIDTDAVILSVGVRPATLLAKEADLELGVREAIRVNEYLQTSVPNIYSGGDCVESKMLVTGNPTWTPLGDTANQHGRIIGTNIAISAAGDQPKARFAGVLGTAIFRVFKLNVGQAGLTERAARAEGLDVEVAIVAGTDKPGYMPGADNVVVKLVAEKGSGRLLGAQVWGEGVVDKPIDTLSTALHFGAGVEDLCNLDLAYAPPFSPALGNVVVAANALENKMNGYTDGILPAEVKRRHEAGEKFVFLDVRNPSEIKEVPMPLEENAVNIPLLELQKRLKRLPKDQEIITSCKIGLRAAEAYRILKGRGFPKVRYMDGGSMAWPYYDK